MKVFLKIVIGLLLVYTILIILHFVFDFKIIDTLINAGLVTIPTIVLILEIEYDPWENGLRPLQQKSYNYFILFPEKIIL